MPGAPDSFHLMLGGLSRSLGVELILDSSGPALAHCDNLDALLLKPSLSELEALTGRKLADEAAEEAAARGLIARGFARAILVSLGSRGALLVTTNHAIRFPEISVPVRSTVGAGDAILAAVTLALSLGWTWEEAVRLGIAAGAAALAAPGTSLARREDVERLHGAPIAAPLRLLATAAQSPGLNAIEPSREGRPSARRPSASPRSPPQSFRRLQLGQAGLGSPYRPGSRSIRSPRFASSLRPAEGCSARRACRRRRP
ncbi:hypothetical protein COC42_11885 [Sphingomonas spermidinifaciens]|uniref:Carbohydrate kinase PfkB domain-containing protein n=1 Tax=Sphingomonas spermidinifaciens TaxID=1141889 RepID=A0A2A4B145_9SPHN|nr:hypothetical protein COC42_11885 [Sphingomonas spermidinifaciens]